MKSQIFREITPLSENDCFLVFDRLKSEFNYPFHFHPEFELNYIFNAEGGKRMVGDHIEIIGKYELVLVGPNLYHGWENFQNSKTEKLHEITIQFPKGLFGDDYLNRNILKPIKDLLHNAESGIVFSEEIAKAIGPRLKRLEKKQGFESFMEFQAILYDLATSKNQQLLVNVSFQPTTVFHNSKRIEEIYKYVADNFGKKLKLEDVAYIFNMTGNSFSRLVKQHTGKSFVDFVNEIRLGNATRRLIESNKSVTDICFECGFNNISNFNRIFKKRKNLTPSEFRDNYNDTRIVF